MASGSGVIVVQGVRQKQIAFTMAPMSFCGDGLIAVASHRLRISNMAVTSR